MKHFYLALAVLFIFAVGCSGGGNSPVMPQKTPDSLGSLPIIGLEGNGDVSQALGLFGAYELTINPDNMTAELVSKRMGAIGDSYIVSGIAFFTIAPCPNCLQIVGVSLDLDGNAWLKFEVSHPFKPGDPGKPPSAANRNDLDVFDLAMVIHPSGGTAQTFTQSSASAYNAICVGASGYTNELANFISDTAVLPYFLCVDDSTDATPPVATFNEFPMGGSTTFEVGFDLTGPLSFDAYLTMGYGHSAVKADRLTPKYWNPEFNRKAAWKVDVDAPTGTTPGTTWDTSDTFPQNVVVSVYDWQIGATVYGTPTDFANSPISNVYSASEPSEVTVEVLGMSTTLPSATTPDDPLATGGPDAPWVFTIPVPNDNLGEGTYPGLVTVSDSRVPVGAPPAATNDYLIDSPDGVLLNFYNIPAFKTYQTFSANVIIACGPITGSITTPVECPNVIGINDGATVAFVVTAASDNGGSITGYDADWDYDGVTFDVDASDATGNFPSAGPFDNPNCGTPPEDPVTYTVAFRATDDCTIPNVTVFATCDVTVDTCAAPPIHSVDYEPKDTGDTYVDVGVQPGGFVYVLANIPPNNINHYRTAIQWTNDLATRQTINPGGSGIGNPMGYGGGTYTNRLDVTPGGRIVNNPVYTTITTWIVTGSSASQAYAGNAISCGGGWTGNIGFTDVWGTTGSGSYVNGALGWTQTTDCGYPNYAGTIWRADAAGAGAFGGLSNPPFYTHSEIVACDAVNGTQNSMFFLESATVARVSVSGSWMNGGFFTQSQLFTFGSLGTGDGQFKGGRDITTDSAGNIVVLDVPTSGTYRFQKFDSTGTFIYSSIWIDEGNPLRMDFDVADNELYVITDTGLHRCEVQ